MVRARKTKGLLRAAEKSINGLPLELLELILSKLTLKSNVHASLVCKRWQDAALSVRVVNPSDVLGVMSAVTRKLDFLNYKVELLSAQVDSLATAVAESDKKWSASEEYKKELDGSSSNRPSQLGAFLPKRISLARTKRTQVEWR